LRKYQQKTSLKYQPSRSAQRLSISCLAIIHAAGEQPGWIVDISSSGALVELAVQDEMYLVGQEIALDIRVPSEAPGPNWARAHGRVVRVHRTEMPRQYAIAIERWG
jgi:hypothetical protein